MTTGVALKLNPPFRAEHIGSLVRPQALKEQRQIHADGQCSLEDLKPYEDAAIKESIEQLRSVGIRTLTDGELRRGMFFEGVFDKMEGMTIIPQRPISEFKEYIPHIGIMKAMGIPAMESVYCTGKIKRTHPWYVDQFKSLKSMVSPEEVGNIKVTMCSPSWFHQRHGSDLTYDLNVYKNDDEYFDDIGIAYRQEIKELYDLGCRHIQFDDPTFCYFCNDKMIAGMEAAGVDHAALLSTYIRSINLCIQGRPEDLVVGVHMCRGNFKGGMHFSEGGYGRISKTVFSQLDVDTFYLEYDTDRAGDFEPLADLPLNKVAVLGLVTTKSPILEDPKALNARVEEAVQVLINGNPPRSRDVALNQLCISTQCGFASVWEGNPVTVEDQKKKLELLVKTAKDIWG